MTARLPETPRTPQSRRAVISAGIIIAASLVAVGIYAWFTLGDTEMSASGYIALVLGAMGTIGLGVGLMALVFYSHRYGYDERVGGENAKDRDGRS